MMTLIFDIDGTLIDSKAVVFPAFRRVLEQFSDQAAPSDEVLGMTFGLPDSKIWEMLLPNASDDTRDKAFHKSEELITQGMFHQSVLLPHALDVLQELHLTGHRLTTASNCGVDYLNAVLDSQSIRKFFTEPLCLGSVNGVKKADILTAHFQRFPKDNAVMIGDRLSDVEAAQEHGITSIGCCFGFGNDDELRMADHLIYSLTDLLSLSRDSALFLPHGRR